MPRGKSARRGDKPGAPRRAMVLLFEPSGDFMPGMEFSLNEVSYGLRNENWADGTAFRCQKRRLVVRHGFLHDCHGKIVFAVKPLGR